MKEHRELPKEYEKNIPQELENAKRFLKEYGITDLSIAEAFELRKLTEECVSFYNRETTEIVNLDPKDPGSSSKRTNIAMERFSSPGQEAAVRFLSNLLDGMEYSGMRKYDIKEGKGTVTDPALIEYIKMRREELTNPHMVQGDEKFAEFQKLKEEYKG